MTTTDHTHAHTEALKLFPPRPPSPPRPTAPAARTTPAGPLRGTLVTDMQVLMKRCAQAGDR
ncbi:hypothetical protein ACIGFK_18445 [Streptomyces sp. NPDC085524]|uniref:hypothetical protein n=1 Tax=Streptomyces sp. NPDC085524 TaxID=3365728 RepID=UPI0037CE8D14